MSLGPWSKHMDTDSSGLIEEGLNKLRCYFFRVVFGSQQNEAEDTEISHILLPAHTHSLPHQQHLHQEGTLITPDLQWRIIITQSWPLTLQFTLDGLHSLGLGKCIIIVSHTVILLPYTSSVFHPSTLPSPQPLAIPDLFAVSIILPFAEHCRVGIIHSVLFSDWLLSLTNTHLSLLPVSSWLVSSFPFSTEWYSNVWMAQFIYSST